MTDTKLTLIEDTFDAVAAAIQNRCYQAGNVEAMRWLERHVRADLDDIESLLLDAEEVHDATG